LYLGSPEGRQLLPLRDSVFIVFKYHVADVFSVGRRRRDVDLEGTVSGSSKYVLATVLSPPRRLIRTDSLAILKQQVA